MEITFRTAQRADIPLILQFIRALADYENMLDHVVADEALLAEWLFDRKKAEVLFAVADSREVGFALFFHNFSPFLGKAGIFLENLFVLPSHRGKGYGRAMFQKLAQIAAARDCGRIEWACLNWNTPSINFYRALGAQPLQDRTTYRLAGETLVRLAQEQ